MDQLAERLDAAADMLTTVDRMVPGLAVPPGAFAAEPDAGLPGRVGRELHARWQDALAARAGEAATAATSLGTLADAVRSTTRAYTDTDGTVASRIARSPHRGV